MTDTFISATVTKCLDICFEINVSDFSCIVFQGLFFNYFLLKQFICFKINVTNVFCDE